MFIRFDMIHERDRQTDGQTPHDGIDRAYALHRAVKTHNIIILFIFLFFYYPSPVITDEQVLFLGATRVGHCVVLSVCESVTQNGPIYFK